MIFNSPLTSRRLSSQTVRQFMKTPAAIAVAMILTPQAAFAACGDATGTTTVNVECQIASGNAELNVNDLNINITGTGTAIDVSAIAGNAVININNATVITDPSSGIGNHGIHAWAGSSSVGDSIINLTGTNMLTVGDLGDTGIVSNGSSAGGNAIITIDGELTLTNSVDNVNYADGVEANAINGISHIIHTGRGTITVHGGNAIFSNSMGTGNSKVELGSEVHLVVDNSVSGMNADNVNSGIRVNSESQIEIDSAAQIDTLGDNAHGIAAYLARSGTGTSIHNSGSIQTGGSGSHGIYSAASASSVIEIINNGIIQTGGSVSHGIYNPAGTANIANNANMTIAGAGSYGIYARAAGSDTITVTGNGAITTTSDSATDRSYGIFASSLDGFNSVTYSGDIMTHAVDSSGIRAAATGTGDVEVAYTGSRIEVFSDNSDGIHASTRVGSTKVNAIGTIITHAKLAGADDGTGHAAFGIAALSSQGNVEATFSGDLIDVNGLNSAAFYGDSRYGSTGTGVGTVSLTNTGKLIARGENGSGIQAFSRTGAITIDNAGEIEVLGYNGASILAQADGAANIDITNRGVLNASGFAASGIQAETAGGSVNIDHSGGIDTLSEQAIVVNHSAPGSLSLKNSGRIVGGIQAVNASTTFDNGGEWGLRNVADTDGDGIRDTLAVAVSNFGAGAIVNDGTIALLGDGGQATILNGSGAYSTGYAVNGMALGGATQAQLLGVQTFSNSGAINMGNGTVGDVLVISGGHAAGASGNGAFVANGGQITVDTVLNEGGANSASDMLVVDSTRLGSAATGIRVNNLGGQGAQTTDDGIELVRVLDSAQSAAGVFTLSGRAVAGAYEYDLYQGGVGANADNGNWYLRSQMASPNPTPASVIRPEAGSYMANMAAAGKMFNLRLEDREGRAENSSMWLRQQGDRTKFRDTSGQLKTATNTYVIQGGGEVASLQFGADDRLGLGLMLGYGTSSSESVNSHSDYRSKGKVDGYNGGVYATWYQDAKTLDGLYVDSWAQYSLLNAEVNGEQLASESYDMKGWSASVESGYRMSVYQGENGRVYVTPQAQVIWSGIKADDHREANGTRVTSDGNNNVQTRLGVKLSRDGVSDMDKGSDKLFTVYTEANWLHNTEQAGATMNGVTTRQAGSTNVGELKVGFEGQLNQHANVWTNVAQQMGDDGYSDTALTVGFKYKF